jgi:hypothetical protein
MWKIIKEKQLKEGAKYILKFLDCNRKDRKCVCVCIQEMGFCLGFCQLVLIHIVLEECPWFVHYGLCTKIEHFLIPINFHYILEFGD